MKKQPLKAMVNHRPRYFAVQIPDKKNHWKVNELRDGNTVAICEITCFGNVLENLLRRGIPAQDAVAIVYEITTTKW